MTNLTESQIKGNVGGSTSSGGFGGAMDAGANVGGGINWSSLVGPAGQSMGQAIGKGQTSQVQMPPYQPYQAPPFQIPMIPQDQSYLDMLMQMAIGGMG